MTSSNDFLDNLANDQYQKMLREISNDDLTPKKHNFKVQKEIHERIDADDDHNNQDYGTGPVVLTEF
jgi:ubiquinone biosynthesis protein COQ9